MQRYRSTIGARGARVVATLLAFGPGAAAAGCGTGELADRMDELADRACACEDAACAREANAAIAALLRRAPDASKAEAESMMASLSRAGSCSRRFTPSAPGPGRAPAEPKD